MFRGREFWRDGDECEVCGKNVGEWWDKSHCRGCGRVVCDGCSTKRCPVVAEGREWEEGYEIKEKRVCELCWCRWEKTSSSAPPYLLGTSYERIMELNIFEKANKVKKHRKKRTSSTESDTPIDMECAICLDMMEVEVTQFRDSTGHQVCRHAFHPCCANLLKQKLCPMCREPFSSIKVDYVV
eukprot:TRINITY_DN580_c0_g1_i1.p1 TRINITY_DN580_c0_g1~~TRINITY_DN580_c0_g1_i1.p1  ORF type:complete len:201 (+),score=21.60 TRINITY_DN580_c0_g1_i1:56-604(+)